jgi:hypothetical protein
MWGTLSDERSGLQFAVAAELLHCSHSLVRMTAAELLHCSHSLVRILQDSLPYITDSNLRLFQPKGFNPPGSEFHLQHTLSLSLSLAPPPPPNSYRSSKLLYDWRSVSTSWCWSHSGTCDQILLPVGMLLSKSRRPVFVGQPLWRDDGSAICSAITQWSESRRTRNHTLLSHLRLPQPGGPGSRELLSNKYFPL